MRAQPLPQPSPAQVGRQARSQRVTFAPTSLRLSATGRESTAVVQPSTVALDGQLSLPDDGQHLGWWSGSSLVGELRGPVVIAGHIDTPAGLGYFSRLLQVSPGDVVTLAGESRSQAYRVTSIDSVAKVDLHDAGFLHGDSPATLVLVTCTGRFDTATHHYQDNLVVRAVPVDRAE